MATAEPSRRPPAAAPAPPRKPSTAAGKRIIAELSSDDDDDDDEVRAAEQAPQPSCRCPLLTRVPRFRARVRHAGGAHTRQMALSCLPMRSERMELMMRRRI